MTDEAVYRFRVRGRVQGVAFRAHTQTRAQDIGVRGWVANAADGSVVGEAAGSPEALAAFRAVLAAGPPAARVDQLDWQPAGAAPAEQDFIIARDVAG